MDTLHDVTLPSDVIKFLEYLQARGRRPSTIKRYRYDLEDFFRYYKENNNNSNNWKELTQADYELFFQYLFTERNYSLSTMKRIHTVLKRLNLFYNLTDTPPEMNLNLEKKTLQKADFISEQEQEQLMKTLQSTSGLTDNQLRSRHLLIDRNIMIVRLLLTYGLTLQELVSLRMKHLHFEQNSLDIQSESSLSRTIELMEDDKQLLYRYIKTIPEPVRPRYHSSDPLFVSFDFQRGTYRWVYEKNAPKRLTEIAIQKMIREEIARSELRKGICAQHMRNTCILDQIKNDKSTEAIQQYFGFKTPLSLKRFYKYVEDHLSVN
ncbi:tyrosine-type recombinase/integrase [Bacillus solimangrovi]|uniref:Integrase n=1 Tax=Bacillus solimangrovi TaxID=1305675 RepID=A0A1E5LJ81_9BACI|nr:phage integrase N-terminal SAM-like domain-containing protein [Bacillus solimangrovi]OEH94121.1 hypothetical protein BFG57_09760 [Bacillus solimangrovi]